MHSVLFDPPIFVSCHGRTRIDCVREGFDFLLACPIQEGPIFESALEACFSALNNPALSADARRGVATFARIHGFLVTEAERHVAAGRSLRVAWNGQTGKRSPSTFA